MKKHFVYILLVSFLCTFPIQAKPHNPQEKAQKMREQLELSEEQFKELQIIFEEKNQMIFEKIQYLKEEIYVIRTELSRDLPDIEAIEFSLKEKGRIMGDIEFIAITRDLDMKALLNEEQWQIFSKHHHSSGSVQKSNLAQNLAKTNLQDSQELENYLRNIKTLVKQIDEDIDLSPEQFIEMEELLKESAKKLYNIRGELLPVIFNIRKELLNSSPNSDKIFDYLEKKSEIIGNMELVSILRDLHLKEILTPQQWDYLKKGMLNKIIFSGNSFFQNPFQFKRKERH